MAEGNGVDLGSIAAMLTNLVSGQEGLRVGQESLRAGQESLRASMERLRTELVGEIDTLRTETRAEFADVRKTMALYHGSVMGHGIAMTELQEQVARINNHLGLSPAAE